MGYRISVSVWISNLGFVFVRSSLNSLFFFRSWMSLSSVISASHWFMADARMRQSIKSLRMLLSLKAVSRIVLSCIGLIVILSS